MCLNVVVLFNAHILSSRVPPMASAPTRGQAPAFKRTDRYSATMKLVRYRLIHLILMHSHLDSS